MTNLITLLVHTPLLLLNLVQDLHDMLSLDFMRYAFLAGTPIAIVCGLVGYFVVLRDLTFATEALDRDSCVRHKCIRNTGAS